MTDFKQTVIVGGTPIELTYAAHSGLLAAQCTRCPWEECIRTGALPSDPPEKEDFLLDRCLPDAVDAARTHTH